MVVHVKIFKISGCEAKNELVNNYNSAALLFENLKRRLAGDEELPNKYHSIFVEVRSLGII